MARASTRKAVPVPKWAKYRSAMAGEFPSPFLGTRDPLALQIRKFVAKLDMLRPEKGGPAYLGDSGALDYADPKVKNDLAAGKVPVATVVRTMGTTDANAFDPIGRVRELLERHPNPPGFGRAVLYADGLRDRGAHAVGPALRPRGAKRSSENSAHSICSGTSACGARCGH